MLLLQSLARRLIGTQTAQWFLGTDNSETLEDGRWGRSEEKITNSSRSENENVTEKLI